MGRNAVLPIAAGLAAAIFALAFVAAPHACEWGLDTYFLAGLGAGIAVFVMPLVLRRDLTLGARLARSFGLGFAMLAVWLGGLFAANVQIICRLF